MGLDYGTAMVFGHEWIQRMVVSQVEFTGMDM
jgi:hypothetical protein